jgi:hypothetical protein
MSFIKKIYENITYSKLNPLILLGFKKNKLEFEDLYNLEEVYNTKTQYELINNETKIKIEK